MSSEVLALRINDLEVLYLINTFCGQRFIKATVNILEHIYHQTKLIRCYLPGTLGAFPRLQLLSYKTKPQLYGTAMK